MDTDLMWEIEITCEACEGRHMLSSELIPRAFEYDCPATRRRVTVPFRDPSRMPGEWVEVNRPSASSVPTLLAELHGKFEL